MTLPEVIHPYIPVDYPYRKQPAYYAEGWGWCDNGRKRRIRKPYHHFVWPKDGKNDSKLGRFKDILRGRGPDIWVTSSANKTDYLWNRPRKSQWSGHMNLDPQEPDYRLSHELPWAKRDPCHAYDFRTRKYSRRSPYMWSDAIWDKKPGRNDWPNAYRDIWGQWIQQWPHMMAHDSGPNCW